jgi:hypothetical protein
MYAHCWFNSLYGLKGEYSKKKSLEGLSKGEGKATTWTPMDHD